MSRFTYAEKLLACQKMAWSKRTWIEQFSGGRAKRPDHEINEQRDLLAKLEDMQADYERAARRDAA